MLLSKKQIVGKARDYVMISLGTLIYAFGFSSFILPHEVVIGGVAGISTLLYFTLNIPIAIASYALNIILLAIAYKVVGKQFVLGTIFGATMISLNMGLCIPLCGDIFHLDPFLSCVIGGILAGTGIGICFTHGGSTGGTDIVAAMVSKYSNVSIGRMMIYVDMCIISSSYFIFQRVETVVYGFVVLFMSSYMADLLINTNRQAVQFTIFSPKWMQIADAINNEAHRGCTVFDGEGWYSKRPVKMLLVMCRKIESVAIFRIIKSIDANAIVTQANVNGVYGQGFDRIKVKLRKEDERPDLHAAIDADTTRDYGGHHVPFEDNSQPARRRHERKPLPEDYNDRTSASRGQTSRTDGSGGSVRI